MLHWGNLMNDRQKLAVLLFRLGGAALILRVLGGLVVLFFAPLSSPIIHQYSLGFLINSSVAYLIVGLIAIFASKPLGKLFGRGLE